MEDRNWSEAQLATRAGVSQPTVSRALTREIKRIGPAQLKLFKYAKLLGTSDSREMRAKRRLISAVEKIWTQSEQHADAVTKIIGALAKLIGRRTQGGAPH